MPDKRTPSGARRRGGALIYLLAGLVILAFLVSVSLPSLCRASEQANRIKCASNLRQLGQALQLYRDRNGGHFPRTRADDSPNPTPVFFTNPAAPNPFASDGPDANDVTAALYLVLRSGDLTPEVLVCPSSVHERSQTDPTTTSNFADDSRLSYSYQNPYAPPAPAAGKATAPATGETGHPDFVLAADLNPGGPEMLDTPADAPRAKIVRINSPNHAGDGQNALYGDGHVDWSTTPFCGVPRPAAGRAKAVRDNIYLAGGPGTAAPPAILAAPADADDSILLPVSSSGPASGALAVQRVGGVREIVWVYAGVAAAVGVVALVPILRLRKRRRRRLATP